MPGLTLDILNTLATGLGWGLIIGGALVFGYYYLPSRPEPAAPPPVEPVVVYNALDFGAVRAKHPLPAAHTELEALEIDGPVHVRRSELIVRAGR